MQRFSLGKLLTKACCIGKQEKRWFDLRGAFAMLTPDYTARDHQETPLDHAIEDKRVRLVYRNVHGSTPKHGYEVLRDTYLLSSPLREAQGSHQHASRLNVNTCPGTLHITEPGRWTRSAFNEPCRAVLLLVPGAHLRLICKKYGYLCRLLDSLTEPSKLVERLAVSLISFPDIRCDRQQLFLDGITQSLLACLFERADAATKNRDIQIRERLSEKELTVSMDFVESVGEAGLTVEGWAKQLGMVPSTFSRRFRNSTNQSPYSWFQDRRIAKAKQLLLDMDVPVAQIALQLGFRTQSHFTEAFRCREGISPVKWQRCHRA